MTDVNERAASNTRIEKDMEGGAVVISAEPESTVPKQRAKADRKSRFTPVEDVIIAQEVAAAKAHIVPHGETIARFKQAALKASANPTFKNAISAKSIQDRFMRLIEDYETRDAKNQVMSGVGGEVGELDELLSDIAEAKRDLVSKKKGEKEEKAEQEQRKLAAGRELILQSLKNKVRKGKDTSSESDDEGIRERAPEKRKLHREDATDGMAAFGEAIKESDLARCAVDRERLALEVRKFEQDVLDRNAERAEREKERAERREEANAQRLLMNQMREDSTKQLNAVLALVGKIIETQK